MSSINIILASQDHSINQYMVLKDLLPNLLPDVFCLMVRIFGLMTVLLYI
jgi:hypothetical protein